MEKAGDDAATKFINALIKSVQTLCHGYLDFHNGIEIIGHINLSVDKGNSLDYILKEKVCKNAENSTLFISNSFHAEPKPEQEVPGKNSQTGNQVVQSKQSTDSASGESGKVSSAISSISSALSGSRERHRRSSTKDSDSHSQQSTAKRKASEDHSESRPAKVPSHHDQLSHTSSGSPFPPTSSSPEDSKASLRALAAMGTSDADMSETMLPQTANVTSDNAADIGVNLAGSVLEPVDDQSNPDLPDRDDDSDGDLEVTFIKEEYVEGERSACEYDNSGQQFGDLHQRGSEVMSDPSLFPVALHSSSSASATYVPSAHELGAIAQHFPPGSVGPSTSQPQPGPSGMRGIVSQHQAAQPLPPGARPGCGYVHPSDAQKWMMYELVPASGVFIHQENYRTVMSKKRDGQPDGKAMARYLMSCFWKQSELVGASIAEPPRPHHRSLDKGIINAILEFCRLRCGSSKRDVQRAIWWKISAANNAEKKRSALALAAVPITPGPGSSAMSAVGSGAVVGNEAAPQSSSSSSFSISSSTTTITTSPTSSSTPSSSFASGSSSYPGVVLGAGVPRLGDSHRQHVVDVVGRGGGGGGVASGVPPDHGSVGHSSHVVAGGAGAGAVAGGGSGQSGQQRREMVSSYSNAIVGPPLRKTDPPVFLDVGPGSFGHWRM